MEPRGETGCVWEVGSAGFGDEWDLGSEGQRGTKDDSVDFSLRKQILDNATS